jgi:hypothetical protein
LNSLHLVPYDVGKSHGGRELTMTLENAGFKVLETRAIMHYPRVLAVAVAGNLARLPTRFFSGHFVACRALKPGKQ